MAKFKIHFAFSQNSFHVPLRWLLAFPKNKQRKTWVNTQRKEMEIYLLNKFWRSNFPIHLWISALPEKFPKLHLGKESCSHFFWHLLIFSLYFLFITALRSINICFGNASNSSYFLLFLQHFKRLLKHDNWMDAWLVSTGERGFSQGSNAPSLAALYFGVELWWLKIQLHLGSN